jgi:hypothetical protein
MSVNRPMMPSPHTPRREIAIASAFVFGSGQIQLFCSVVELNLLQSLYGSNSPAGAIATPNGRSVCSTRIVPSCARSTSGSRL